MVSHDFAGYTLIRRLGSGGMTDLYIALDSNQNRVVLRRLKSDHLQDRRLRKSFMEGAEILGNLNHPNIIRLLDAGCFQHEPFTAVEYVDAKNLKDLILQKAPLLQQQALSMIRQMAGALEHLHTAGYWHLDFKPENLLVRDNGTVVLIDFDLAMKRNYKPVKLSPLPGTFAYLPPEALALNLVDDQTDIFGYGVTCYEMLSGHKPFEGMTMEEARRNQMNPQLPPVRLALHNVNPPSSLEALIFKCLAKQKDERYPSASLITRDLETMR